MQHRVPNSERDHLYVAARFIVPASRKVEPQIAQKALITLIERAAPTATLST